MPNDNRHFDNQDKAPSRRKSAEELDKMVREKLNNTVPEALYKKLNQRIDAFGNYLATRSTPSGWRRMLLPYEWRWAYSLAMALVVIALSFFALGGNAPPTWAEVTERFSAVSYMHATIYVKPSPLEAAAQSELWLQDDGKIRFRAGNAMLFGDGFNIHTTVPYTGRDSLAPDPLGAQEIIREVIEKIGQAEVFSLEVLVHALPVEGELSAPLANENASISKDLVVFDLTHKAQDDWLRIWALRDSRLPVRLMYWNPRNGESIDVVLSYAGPQPAEFYDPEAFQAHLEQYPDHLMHWAYGLMRDVDGLPMVAGASQ